MHGECLNANDSISTFNSYLPRFNGQCSTFTHEGLKFAWLSYSHKVTFYERRLSASKEPITYRRSCLLDAVYPFARMHRKEYLRNKRHGIFTCEFAIRLQCRSVHCMSCSRPGSFHRSTLLSTALTRVILLHARATSFALLSSFVSSMQYGKRTRPRCVWTAPCLAEVSNTATAPSELIEERKTFQ